MPRKKKVLTEAQLAFLKRLGGLSLADLRAQAEVNIAARAAARAAAEPTTEGGE